MVIKYFRVCGSTLHALLLPQGMLPCCRQQKKESIGKKIVALKGYAKKKKLLYDVVLFGQGLLDLPSPSLPKEEISHMSICQLTISHWFRCPQTDSMLILKCK